MLAPAVPSASQGDAAPLLGHPPTPAPRQATSTAERRSTAFAPAFVGAAGSGAESRERRNGADHLFAVLSPALERAQRRVP